MSFLNYILRRKHHDELLAPVDHWYVVQLIWGGDHSIDEEDFPCSSDEFGMVTNLSCAKCGGDHVLL